MTKVRKAKLVRKGRLGQKAMRDRQEQRVQLVLLERLEQRVRRAFKESQVMTAPMVLTELPVRPERQGLRVRLAQLVRRGSKE